MRRKVTREDITKDHLDLMAKALTIPEDHFLCFGKYYYVLHDLNLVDKENQLTFEGRMMARQWIQYKALEEERSEKAKTQG